jgi:hypothetical protein
MRQPKDNLYSRQILRQSSAIESIFNSVIGNICLTSETNQEILAEKVSIVSRSRSLKKFGSNYRDEFVNVADCCYDQNIQLPARNDEMFSCQNNPDDLFHVHTKDPKVNEFSFSHGEVLYHVGMKHLGKGVFNQIGYAVLEVSRTLKQGIELRLNQGRLFNTKSGIFGINESSYYQFDQDIIKLATATYSPVVN